METVFSHTKPFPADPILGLSVSYAKDPRETKVNLSVGVYKTEDGVVPILGCVKEAESFILKSETTKSYLPIDGDVSYLQESGKLILGQELFNQKRSSLSLMQTLGGTGALRLGGDLIAQELLGSSCYIPDPSWPNHRAIFEQSGLEVLSYPYYDTVKKDVDFSSLMSFVSSLRPRSVVVLHVNCHNPSGADLDLEQWKSIAKLCKRRQLLPFFDGAYLGFSSSFEEDASPLRLFVEQNVEFLAAISFSKNFALYAERTGVLMGHFKEGSSAPVLTHLKKLARRNYSNPPCHGAKTIAHILKTPALKALWDAELLDMKIRIDTLRREFVGRLSSLPTGKDYSYLLSKKGLFSYCDLSQQQVASIIELHGIYMTSDGRINIAGLNQENMERVVLAIVAVGG